MIDATGLKIYTISFSIRLPSWQFVGIAEIVVFNSNRHIVLIESSTRNPLSVFFPDTTVIAHICHTVFNDLKIEKKK